MAIILKPTDKLDEKSINNYVLFADENYSLFSVGSSFIFKDLKNFTKSINKTSKKRDFLTFNLNSKQTAIIIKLKKNQSELENETGGASFYEFLKKAEINEITFSDKNIYSASQKNIFINDFIHGMLLKSYEFEKYKTKKSNYNLKINCNKKLLLPNLNSKYRYKPLIEGINFTKELVSEPGNILHPDEYAKRLKQLSKIGLKVSIYDKKKLKNLGMNALVGVGQGSIRGSYLVTLEWKGSKSKKDPVAFVGKGVCFDTGGISLKPAKFMEDMTYDMAGSAVVVGLMKTLALRKANVNAVGVVGLVENMPDGNAQRPGDIVKSYSGKTIEILNTDAEGRLVLADALTFTEQKFKPKFIVDLATLTGAIIVSLGSEYAGLFSNDDKLSAQLSNAGEKVGEKVWRMPLHKNYDKLINSKNADMQNINYIGGAGSTTAAQFLQRFILKKTPWAHLDIAGMAFSKYNGALNSWGATGFGVRLLNKLIEDNYE
ncbi:leucyl aminopeptidase [Candidatus Pelagibacter sp.]|uniref:leucyl aminopeptidase n=1 Tax=Candidatus Pelagibacter sp. TaxID=2024849 RepID=UPI003F862A06